MDFSIVSNKVYYVISSRIIILQQEWCIYISRKSRIRI